VHPQEVCGTSYGVVCRTMSNANQGGFLDSIFCTALIVLEIKTFL
jgi:hypothetical protein